MDSKTQSTETAFFIQSPSYFPCLPSSRICIYDKSIILLESDKEDSKGVSISLNVLKTFSTVFRTLLENEAPDVLPVNIPYEELRIVFDYVFQINTTLSPEKIRVITYHFFKWDFSQKSSHVDSLIRNIFSSFENLTHIASGSEAYYKPYILALMSTKFSLSAKNKSSISSEYLKSLPNAIKIMIFDSFAESPICGTIN